MKHYICRRCGDIVAMVNGGGERLSCCSSRMEELTPKWEGQGAEKHTPSMEQFGNRVHIWLPHPMEREHRVDWICLVTDKGSQRKLLSPLGESSADFYLDDGERVIRAFAYCNLHGLWVLDIAKNQDSKQSEK
ncbi:MAG: desulfoferrodoxin [Clostridia bacterium]|nr:desulfoferrodoxin [Clostridia bacterium]